MGAGGPHTGQGRCRHRAQSGAARGRLHAVMAEHLEKPFSTAIWRQLTPGHNQLRNRADPGQVPCCLPRGPSRCTRATHTAGPHLRQSSPECTWRSTLGPHAADRGPPGSSELSVQSGSSPPELGQSTASSALRQRSGWSELRSHEERAVVPRRRDHRQEGNTTGFRPWRACPGPPPSPALQRLDKRVF